MILTLEGCGDGGETMAEQSEKYKEPFGNGTLMVAQWNIKIGLFSQLLLKISKII